MKTRVVLGFAAAVVWFAAAVVWFAAAPLSASAQTRSVSGDAEAGRALALTACTGCHVVSPAQRFKPLYVGSPRPPSFKEIAGKPSLTPDSLRQHLETLPAVPQKPGMPNPDLSANELRDVVAFILTLRDTAAPLR